MDQQQSITPAFWFGEYRDGYTDHVYARYGQEPGWVDGESRELDRPHPVRRYRWGYYGARTWCAAMQSGAPSRRSTIACKILLRPVAWRGEKVLVGDWKRLIKHADARREMRLFVADVADRLLNNIVGEGHSRYHDRMQHAVTEARRYARGECDYNELVEAQKCLKSANVADGRTEIFEVWSAALNATGDSEVDAVREVLTYSNWIDLPWIYPLFDSWMEAAFVRAAFARASGEEVTQTCDGSQ